MTRPSGGERRHGDVAARRPERVFTGIPGSPGIAFGNLVPAAPPGQEAAGTGDKRVLLYGRSLDPASLTSLPLESIAGLVCTGEAPLSHGVVLARSLGIPVVIGVQGLGLEAGARPCPAIVDGYRGRLILHPRPEVLAEHRAWIAAEQALEEELGRETGLPSRTSDGAALALEANIALLRDIGPARRAGARAVGLYRSELLFLGRGEPPDEKSQTAAYRELLSAFAPQPVNVRTLDAGSDKPLPWVTGREVNPALGRRGIRLSLAHPELFLTQLRALVQANAGLGNLRLILPMVTLPEEVRAARALLEQASREVRGPVPPVGVMLEVPAAVLRVDALCAQVGLVSIGTNDLSQYVLAADRTSPDLGTMVDYLTPAVLEAIRLAVTGARRRGAEVNVCGEMAADPLGVPLLLALGADSLSVPPRAIPRIRRLVRGLTRVQAQRLWREARRLGGAAEVRALMREALKSQGLGCLIGPAD